MELRLGAVRAHGMSTAKLKGGLKNKKAREEKHNKLRTKSEKEEFG